MRKKETSGYLSVNAIAGSYVKYLDPTDGWCADYYKSGSPKQKERAYFAG